LKAADYLRNENLDDPGRSGPIDERYAVLLDRYKTSDSDPVRYTAEFESTRLTKHVNVQLWLDALARSGTPYQVMAQQVIASHLLRGIEAEGKEAAGIDRSELVASALNLEPVDRRLVPRELPQEADIRQVRRLRRFGLVAAVFGSGSLGLNGYLMLFERRGNRWVFLCIVKSWIHRPARLDGRARLLDPEARATGR
jgi:hypothetical protein